MVIPIRATWSSGAYYLQGANNAALVRQLNLLKRELTKQNDQLLIDHQDEDIIDGGEAKSIQFHYVISPPDDMIGFQGSKFAPTGPTISPFDANNGATGTANYVFNLRRDILKRENLRNF
jgi:hypothetical protein